jgi:hypothetical protein
MVGKPDRKRPLEKHRDRWENIKLDLNTQDGKARAAFT